MILAYNIGKVSILRLNIEQLPYDINIKDVTNYENVIILINAIIQMFHCRYFVNVNQFNPAFTVWNFQYCGYV